jgi:hypothetical protein
MTHSDRFKCLLLFIVLLMPARASAQGDVQVCLIDPAIRGGFRMQAAKILNAGDTVITLRDANHLMREAVPVAAYADWYINGTALLIGAGRDSIDLRTYGSPRAMTADQLAMIGFTRGMPIYVERRDAALLLQEIPEDSLGRRSGDLGHLLAANRMARGRIDGVHVFYVPIALLGCMFQALLRVEAFRN